MNTTISFQDLSSQIEQVIQAHMAASYKVATSAVEQAFAAAARTRGAPRPSPSARAPGRRRAGAEIAALGERFFSAVCAKPGEGMAVLAAEVGASARELNRSVRYLRQAGRIRSVGQRHLTRYFPMAN